LTNTVINKRLVKNIFSLGLLQLATYVMPLISVPVISRIIGAGKFGVLEYAFAFTSYFTLLISYGFDFTATRKIAKDPGNITLRRKVFSEVLAAQLFLFLLSGIIFTICLWQVAPLTGEKKVAIFTFITCIATLLTQNWLFQAMQDLPKIVAINLVGKILFTLIVLWIIKVKEDYIWQPLLLSLINILVALISFIWAFKKYSLRIVPVSFQQIISLLKQERAVFLSMAVISLYTTTNTIMLGILKSESEVGYFTSAQKLILVATSLINLPVTQAMYPYLGSAFGKSREEGTITVQKILPLIVFFTGGLSLVMFLMGPWVLHWFYGSLFDPSIPAFQVMAFLTMIVAISNVFGIQVMLNLKMDKYFFRITASGALLGLLLNYFMTSKLGYMGTAWNWLIVEIYITTVMYLVLRAKGINVIDIKQFKPSAMMSQLRPLTEKWLKRK
jgi:O-antigen/teichoic acid export membrane protein